MSHSTLKTNTTPMAGLSEIICTDALTQSLWVHLFCFISNAVKNQPVDRLENFDGVA